MRRRGKGRRPDGSALKLAFDDNEAIADALAEKVAHFEFRTRREVERSDGAAPALGRKPNASRKRRLSALPFGPLAVDKKVVRCIA